MSRRNPFTDASAPPRPCAWRDDGLRLTTENIDKACHARRLGLPKALIAKFVGVQRSTFFEWLTRGKYEEAEPFRTFYNLFTQAEGEGAHGYLSIVGTVAAGGTVVSRKVVTKANGQTEVSETRQAPNALAAQWILERVFPREFGPNKLEIAYLEAQNKHLTDRLAKLSGLEDTTSEAGPAKPAAGGDPPADSANHAESPHGASAEPPFVDGVGVPFDIF